MSLFRSRTECVFEEMQAFLEKKKQLREQYAQDSKHRRDKEK
jgi:hypothetical protein